MKVQACAVLVLLVASTASAARPFSVEDMQKLARVGGTRISPDGKWVAFTVTNSDVAKNRMVTNLWMIPAAGGNAQQLTFADHGSNSDPRWSPDSLYLYFISNRVDNKRQIFRLPVTGGEAKAITTLPTGVGDYFLSPDGKTVALTASVYPECADMACNEKAAKERENNPVKVRVITEIPFRRWDEWVDGKRTHIFTVPAEGGRRKT